MKIQLLNSANKITKLVLFGTAAFIVSGFFIASEVRAQTVTCSNEVGPQVLIDTVQNITNDVDSGNHGNWALDAYTRHLQVWQIGESTYCAKASYDGTFHAPAGVLSPQNGITLTTSVDGTMIGGYTKTVTGTIKASSSIPTALDYGGTLANISTWTQNSLPASYNGGTSQNWLDEIFETGYKGEFIDGGNGWSWTYTTSNNGVWVNAGTGSTGDIGLFVNKQTNAVYSTIQEAINAASDGNTISLGADATTTAQITITKAITIDGNGHTISPTFSKASGSDYTNNSAIGIQHSDVIIKNLILDGKNGGQSYPTQLHGINVYKSTNVNLDTVTISHFGGSGIVVNGSTVTAVNLTTNGNGWNAVNVDPGKGVLDPSVFTLTSGTLADINQIWSDGGNVTSTATVAVNAAGYTQYAISNSKGILWSDKPLANTAAIIKDGVGTAYSSIQSAIDATTPGDTITIGAGTYKESLLINKPLILSGVNGTVLVGTSTANYILKVDGVSGDTAISNIEINGGGSARGANTFDYGVWVNNSGTNATPIELKNLSVSNVWNASANGIEIDSGSVASIHDNTVSGFDKRGIRFINSSGKVYNNEVIGQGVDGVTQVQNLINLWGGSTVEINGNKLHNAATTGPNPKWDSVGVLVTSYDGATNANPSAATIHDNEIYSSDTGITVGSFYVNDADNSTAVITHNTFHDLHQAINLEKGTVTATIHNNFFGINTPKAVNSDDGNGGPASPATVIATENWWGNSSGPTTGQVYGGVLFSPWYTDASSTELKTSTTHSDDTASTTLPVALTQNGTANGIAITVEIPKDVVVTGNAAWTGNIATPLETTKTLSFSGFDTTVNSAIAIGSNDSDLTFDKGVRILFAGQKDKSIGWYNHAGTFSEITAVCATDDQAMGDALPEGTDCKINSGNDLVVWTKHFTTFITYTKTAIPAPTPSPVVSSGGGGGGGYSVYSSNKAITSFIISGQIGSSVINETAHTIMVTMPVGTNLTALIPTSVISGAAVTPNRTAVDFTTPKTFTVTAADGSTQAYIVTVTTGTTAPIAVQTQSTTTEAQGQVLGVSTFNFTAALHKGSKGDDVIELQNRLTTEGVYSGPISGYFGSLTEAAVKAFQKKHNIETTGFVGPKTITQLNSSASQVTTAEVGQVLGASTSADAERTAALRAQLISLMTELVKLLKAETGVQ